MSTRIEICLHSDCKVRPLVHSTLWSERRYYVGSKEKERVMLTYVVFVGVIKRINDGRLGGPLILFHRFSQFLEILLRLPPPHLKNVLDKFHSRHSQL